MSRLLPLEEIFPNHSLSEEVVRKLNEAAEVIEVPRKTILLKENEITNTIWYLISGLVIFYQFENETTRVTRFAGAKEFFTSVTSYFEREGSIEQIETCDHCILVVLPRNRLNMLIQEHPELKDFIHLAAIKKMVSERNLAQKRGLLTASGKYSFLLDQYPGISLTVSHRRIASYLNITEETLSRVKKRHSNS